MRGVLGSSPREHDHRAAADDAIDRAEHRRHGWNSAARDRRCSARSMTSATACGQSGRMSCNRRHSVGRRVLARERRRRAATHFFGHLGGIELGHCGLGEAWPAGIAQRGRMQHHLPRDRHLRRHVGQPELHRLVIDDLGAERLALAGIGAGRFERGARHADRLRGDADAAGLEIGQRDAIALALLAQQRVGADLAVLEGDLAGVGRLLAELLLDRGDAIARRLRRHDEARDAALGGGWDRSPRRPAPYRRCGPR